MPSNTAATQARLYNTDQVHYLAKTITFDDDGIVHTLGILPAGAVVIKPASGVQVHTVFNAGTNNFLDVGTAATGDLFATDLALGSVAFVPLDEAVGLRVAADTTITATVQLSGTAATTGAATVLIAYILPDR
jgi:hypothetical protein